LKELNVIVTYLCCQLGSGGDLFENKKSIPDSSNFQSLTTYDEDDDNANNLT